MKKILLIFLKFGGKYFNGMQWTIQYFMGIFESVRVIFAAMKAILRPQEV